MTNGQAEKVQSQLTVMGYFWELKRKEVFSYFPLGKKSTTYKLPPRLFSTAAISALLCRVNMGIN